MNNNELIKQIEDDVLTGYNEMAKAIYVKYCHLAEPSIIRLITLKTINTHIADKTIEVLNSSVKSQNRKLDKILTKIEEKELLAKEANMRDFEVAFNKE